MMISPQILLRIRNILNNVVQKIKTHILCSIIRSVYEIMSKNMVETKNDVTTWRIRTACWISKATRMFKPTQPGNRTHARTHTQKYVKLIAFPRQKLFANAPLCLPCLPLRLYFFIERKGPFYPENGDSTSSQNRNLQEKMEPKILTVHITEYLLHKLQNSWILHAI